MRRKILTKLEIREARELRKQGKTKRELAIIFGVGQTTIWDNIYRTRKPERIYVYKKTIKVKKIPCESCEILLTRDIKGRFIPHNYKIGNKCITCYLKEKGLKYSDLLNV